MTTLIMRSIALFVLASATVLHAQVPQFINYQGRVAVGTVNFDGSGLFKFALVNTNGSTTYWSNDGTSTAGSQPTSAVALTVAKGLYSVLLGDTALANMAAIPASVFANADVRLRVWFNDGTNGSQLLTPDQRIAAVGYAIMAGNVTDGSITSAKIANGAVGTSQIATGAVTTLQIASGAVGSTQLANGAITPDKLARPVRTGSVSSTSLAVDPAGVSFTVPLNPSFGAVPIVTLSLDAADGTTPSRARLSLTGRTVDHFTARVSNGTTAPLTFMTPIVVDAGSGIGSGAIGQYASLAVVNGNPAIAYQATPNRDLKYVRATDADGTAWSTAVTLDFSGDVGSHICLAVVNGNPAMSYYDSTNLDLKYVRATDADGTTWGTPVTIDSTGNVGQYTSLTVVSGNPAISYFDATNNTVKYVRATDPSGTAWGVLLTLDSATAKPSTLLMVNGNPAISYPGSGTGKYVRANDASGTTWGAPVLVGSGLSGSMAIVNGNPAIIGYNMSSAFVRANDPNGASWGAAVQTGISSLVGISLIVIDDTPAVLGGGYTRSLDASGTVWSSQVFFGAVSGNFPVLSTVTTSFALVNGQPAVAWTSNNTDLVFTRAGAALPFTILWMALEP